jgi:hypothetical protein
MGMMGYVSPYYFWDASFRTKEKPLVMRGHLFI